MFSLEILQILRQLLSLMLMVQQIYFIIVILNSLQRQMVLVLQVFLQQLLSKLPSTMVMQIATSLWVAVLVLQLLIQLQMLVET